MRKLFIGLVLIAVIAGSLFAFVACNDEPYVPTIEQGWSAKTEFLAESSNGVINFVSAKHWRVDVGGMAASFIPDDNDNWCRGEYRFEGEVGKSDLHMILLGEDDWYFEEFEEDEMDNDNSPAYDPQNVVLLDADGKEVPHGEEAVFAPDEAGVYNFTILLKGALGNIANMGGSPEEGMLKFAFYPPQDGTLGSNGDMAPPPPSSGPDMFAIIIAVPIAAVVLIVGIVVTVVLVKKNKKKKAAAAAANDNGGDFSGGGFAA